MIYLDHYTASPLRPNVAPVMAAVGRTGGNASSVHQLGRTARRTLQIARGHVQRLVGAHAARSEVIFCGSPAEARSLSILGLAQRLVGGSEKKAIVFDADLFRSCPGLIQQLCLMGFVVGQISWPQKACQLVIRRYALGHKFWEAKHVPIEPVDVAVLVISALSAQGQSPPWTRLVEFTRRFSSSLIVDATLGAGRLSLDAEQDNVAVTCLASAPLGGPAGIAAVVRRKSVDLQPLWGGGGQNFGVRSGTEATILAAGFGEAARQAYQQRAEEQRRLGELRDVLSAGFSHLIAPQSCAEALLWPMPATHVTACVGRFDSAGVMVGWAAGGASHDDPACIRMTLGWDTTAFMIHSARAVLTKLASKHKDLVCAS